MFVEEMMKIRQARLDDIPKLLPLFTELGYSTSLQDLTIRFQKFLKNIGSDIIVCEWNKEIIGWIAWSKTDFLLSNKTRFHIEGLVVASTYRNKGVGKKLMRFVEEIARQHSPAVLDLTSSLKRAKDGTHDFYKNLGYRNDGTTAKVYLRKQI